MLFTLAVLLFVLWAVGILSGAQLGWWLHVVLVLAVIALAVSIVRRAAAR